MANLKNTSNLTLGAVLNSHNQYVIPVFHRYYRWDQPEWEKLWDDLAELQQPGRTGRRFMAFLVPLPESVVSGQVAKYRPIDGRRRLTTLSLVLFALSDVATAPGLPELAREVTLTTLEHRFRRGTDRFRHFPKLRDRDQYAWPAPGVSTKGKSGGRRASTSPWTAAIWRGRGGAISEARTAGISSPEARRCKPSVEPSRRLTSSGHSTHSRWPGRPTNTRPSHA